MLFKDEIQSPTLLKPIESPVKSFITVIRIVGELIADTHTDKFYNITKDKVDTFIICVSSCKVYMAVLTSTKNAVHFSLFRNTKILATLQ